MKHVVVYPEGVCTKKIEFDLSDQNTIHNVNFSNGCPGNLTAIAKLADGQPSKRLIELLEGNTCGPRPTSCTDQLAKAIIKNL